jgi:hypothetical protein
VALVRHQTFFTVLLVSALTVGANACGDDDATAPTSDASPSVASTTDSPTVTSASTSPLVVTEYEGGVTYLTGHVEGFIIDEGSLETDADGVDHSRDGTISYRVVTDDPRVTGMVNGTWNTDRWGDLYNGAMTQWGTATLTNESGTWEGDYAGGFASPVGDVIARWWRGTGEYEGLTFYMWIAGSEPGVPMFDIGGIIFPGDPPPTVGS